MAWSKKKQLVKLRSKEVGILKHFHDGTIERHLGMKETLMREIQSIFFYVNLKDDIHD